MQIKHYLAILITLCLGLGYAMEAMLSKYHYETNEMVEVDHQYSLAARDVDRLNNDILQYIITVDLILGSDQNYLLPGALRMSALLVEQTNHQDDSLLQKHHNDSLLNIRSSVNKINALLQRSASLDEDNRESKLYDLLIESDDLSDQLITTIEATANAIHASGKDHALETKKSVQSAEKSSFLVRCAYGLFILICWVWINRSITKPISRLIKGAKKMEGDKDITLDHKGPEEVQFLSRQIESTAQKLLHQALHDPLTGLNNRREFSQKLKAAFLKDQDTLNKIFHFENKIPMQHGRVKSLLKESPKRPQPLCICLIDLDHFKAVNDNCGHSAGDELLIITANEIQQACGEDSIVARLGGDEFGVLFIDTPKQECLDRIDDILERIRNIHFERNTSVYRISASIGITFVTDPTIDISEWMNTADSGCFVAKDCGRDNRQVMAINDDRINAIRNETKVYNDVIKALDEERFILYHQKIVGLQETNSEEHAFEILVRMIAEDGSIVAPRYFMDTVERFDLITKLDHWVISQTIQWLEEHPQEAMAISHCSINLSGKSLASKAMHDFLKDLMSHTSVEPGKICFEITETAAVNDINQAQRLIKSLRSIGCRFALDDFGSGLSSFAYLRKLDVDFIKIDGSFVKNLVESDFDQAMVNNIHELAKNINMKTVAEFTESSGIADILKTMGIHYAQGYYFHQPEPLETSLPLALSPQLGHSRPVLRH